MPSETSSEQRLWEFDADERGAWNRRYSEQENLSFEPDPFLLAVSVVTRSGSPNCAGRSLSSTSLRWHSKRLRRRPNNVESISTSWYVILTRGVPIARNTIWCWSFTTYSVIYLAPWNPRLSPAGC